ncbi:hypothetical protein [Frigidibacter sp. MR17.24]|uniref:hypothetical protein n=1 Tax=Frigidibacter sp. MR17.24 TaxID=3127345 RepID=UPI0030130095
MPPMMQPPYAEADRRSVSGRIYEPSGRLRPRGEAPRRLDRDLVLRLSLGVNLALVVLLIGAIRPF